MGWLDNVRTRRAIRAKAQNVTGALLPGMTRNPPGRDVTGMLEAYGQSPWVAAVTSKIAVSFGAVQWRAYAVREIGTKYKWRKVKRLQKSGVISQDARRKLVDLPEGLELVEIPDTPLLDFIEDGSPMFPGNTSRMLTQLYLELTGEAYWLMVPGAVDGMTIPIEYFLLPPTWVLNTPSSSKDSFEVKFPELGETMDVPREMMVWFLKPNPLNPYKRGLGRMRSLGDEIDADEYASKFVRSWFFNRARPDILIYGKGIHKEDVERLEVKWLQKLRGHMRQHLPFFLSAAVEVKDLSQKMIDMQINDLRKFERDIIIHARGVPAESLGIVEDSNRATAQVADHTFNAGVLTPELEFFRETLQTHVVPLFDDRIILGYVSPVGADKEYQLDVAKAQPAALDLNDWRTLGGFDKDPELEGLRVVKLQDRIVQTSALPEFGTREVTPLPAEGKTPALPERTPSKAATTSVDVPSGLPAPDGTRGNTDPDVPKIGVGRERIVFDQKTGDVEIVKQVGGLETTNLATDLSAQMVDDLLDAWAQLKGEIPMTQLAAALESGGTGAALAIIDGLDVEAALESAVATLRQAVIMVGGVAAEQIVEALGLEIAFEIASATAIDELAAYGAEMVTNVSDETIQAIRSALVESYSAGNTANEVAKEIRSLVGLTERDARSAVAERARLIDEGLSQSQADEAMEKWIAKKIRKRSETIAVNELVEAGTRGQEIVWEEAERQGLITRDSTRREWIANPGACELCQPNHGLRAKLGEPFETKTAGLIYTPNDIHVRCRCGERLVFVS